MRTLADGTLRVEVAEQHEAPSSPADPGLNDLVRLTALTCNSPVAIVTLIVGDMRVYKAAVGIALREGQEDLESRTPFGKTVTADAVFEVPDAYLDADYAATGIEVAGRIFRYYGGTPLISPAGTTLGTLFVLDAVPRRLSASQKDALAILSRQVVARLELNSGVRKMEQTLHAQQRTDTALTVERNFVSAVLDTLGALVAVFDTAGRVVRFNRACETISGYTSAELVGRYVWERLIPGEDIAEAMREFHSIREGGFPITYENSWKTREGDLRRIAWSATALLDAQRQVAFIIATGIDVTEKIQAEGDLRALVRQSNSVLESVGDGIFGLDLEGKVTIINPAAAQMLGYRPEEMLGRSMHELIHHSYSDGLPYPWGLCPINQSLKQLEASRVSTEVFWRKDGSSFPVDYVVRPQIDTETRGGRLGGGAVGVVVAFTDSTERRALDRMKDEFIATVSHELRTPLTSLRASLGLIQSGALSDKPERAKQMLQIAVGNTDRLVRLVNDILDMERISSGMTELNYKMFGLGEMLRQAAATQAADAAKSNIQFTVEAQDVVAWADPERIQQTLTNLISNAIKFSPKGSQIVFKASRAASGEVQIEVQDSGPGIPEDQLEQIFDRFRQIDASDTRARGGTGLGLAICRSIVMQHGGRIWATSKPDEGSSFFFTLPPKPVGHLG